MVHLVSVFAPALDQYRKLWAKEAAIRAAEAKADDLPRVKLTTTKGEITLELFENEAAANRGQFSHRSSNRVSTTAARSIACCRRSWPRAARKPMTARVGRATPFAANVRSRTHRHHFRGSLSMAHLPNLPDSGSSQFFLTFVPTPHSGWRAHRLRPRDRRHRSARRHPAPRSAAAQSAAARQNSQSRSAPRPRPRIQIRQAAGAISEKDGLLYIPAPRSLLQNEPVVARDQQAVLLSRVLDEHHPLSAKQLVRTHRPRLLGRTDRPQPL